MKPTRTWILIADGARARILQNDGPGKGLHEVEGLRLSTAIMPPPTRSCRTGRAGATAPSGRAARPSRPIPIPTGSSRRSLPTSWRTCWRSGLQPKAYDRLVIVAAPSALGDLRAAMSEQVRAKVTGEVAKDLTKTPDGEVAGAPEGCALGLTGPHPLSPRFDAGSEDVGVSVADAEHQAVAVDRPIVGDAAAR